MTKSTTSEGWLRKSNFTKEKEDPIQATIWLKVAPIHVTHYLSNGIREYIQWFCGAENNVTNALFQSNERTEDKLTKILRSHCSSQLLQHFEVVPRPPCCSNCPSNSSWWKHNWLWNYDVELLHRVLQKYRTWQQSFPQRNVPNTQDQNPQRFHRGCASRTTFLTMWCSPGSENTVADTLNHVAATFRENGQEGPKQDVDHNVARLLWPQLMRFYKKDNPKEVQQNALTICILHLIFSSKSTELYQAIGKLAGACHFWVVHSCKYAKVPKAEQKKTNNFASGMLPLPKMAKSSTTALLISNLQTAFW